MNRPGLDALIEASIEAVNKMTPEEKAKMHREQRISWVYGNLALDDPSITRVMVEEAAKTWP